MPTHDTHYAISAKDRADFLAALAREAPEIQPESLRIIANRLIRFARESCRYATADCNGDPLSPIQRRRYDQLPDLVRLYLQSVGLGWIKVCLGGDARGYTMRLHFSRVPQHNTWGGPKHGFGVPGS